MSKRQLKQFLSQLSRKEVEAQVEDLYSRFKNVKEFYDFSFNPNENKRYQEAKQKIAKEYFPEGKRKAKKRRSVAQNIFKHLLKLEFDSELIADLMFFNLEIAQAYTAESPIKQYAFYKSMLKSFRYALTFSIQHGLKSEMQARVDAIIRQTHQQKWENAEGFELAKKELWF